MLFSATLPEWVISLSRKYLRGDKTKTIDLLVDKPMKTPKDIQHYVVSSRGKSSI